MYEEQFLISRGCPFSEAVSLCHSLRKEQKLDEFMWELQRPAEHVCHCGGVGDCKDCPHR